MTLIGRIERLNIRDVWPHEAHSFTRWLFTNLDVLGEALGWPIAGVRPEASTGTFSVDILGRDARGQTVIIENQFGNSDHDHLGKLLTYAANFDAAAAVWIVEQARPEHLEAVNWLNEVSPGTQFYLVQVRVVRIGDSQPAPQFSVVAEPTDELRRVGDEKRSLSDEGSKLSQFWGALINVADSRQSMHAGMAPRPSQYLPTASGVAGASYTYCVFKRTMRVELYIARGSETASNALFDRLLEHKSVVEAAFGDSLVWERLDGRKSCRLKVDLPDGGFEDVKAHHDIVHAAVEIMDRFVEATRPALFAAADEERL